VAGNRRSGSGRPRRKLDPGAFGYIAGGAVANEKLWRHLDASGMAIRPSMRPATSPATYPSLCLGLRSPAPFLLATRSGLRSNTGGRRSAWPRQTHLYGVPFVLSSAATPIR